MRVVAKGPTEEVAPKDAGPEYLLQPDDPEIREPSN